MKLIRRGPSPWLPQSYVRWRDKDQDGIPDKIEEELLRRFRPYYKFSEKRHELTILGFVTLKENYRPTDPIWQQMIYAELRTDDWRPGHEPAIVDTGHLDSDGNPDNLIEPLNLLNYCNGDIDLLKFHHKTSYCLNMADDKRGGPEWDDAIKYAPGLYGHVVPADDDTGHYKIEYWQYFAYSGTDIAFGLADHEGDWCTVQLWYDPNTDKLAKTSHFHHGDETSFYFTEDTVRRNIVIDAVNMVEYSNQNGGTTHRVRFYIDDEGNEHVVVYIERDGHEFWPTEEGDEFGANEHNGKGASYLTAYDPARPLNLGEVENWLSDDARIIMCFNGHWGCWHEWPGNNPPPGPALHKEWTWPKGSVLRKAIRDEGHDGDFES